MNSGLLCAFVSAYAVDQGSPCTRMYLCFSGKTAPMCVQVFLVEFRHSGQLCQYLYYIWKSIILSCEQIACLAAEKHFGVLQRRYVLYSEWYKCNHVLN